MRTFTFQEGASNKFWKIELKGNEFTVKFGKAGTAGQTQVKSFADAAAALKEHDKLLAEKVKRGYVETTTAITSAPAPTPAYEEEEKSSMRPDTVKKGYREIPAVGGDAQAIKELFRAQTICPDTVTVTDGVNRQTSQTYRLSCDEITFQQGRKGSDAITLQSAWQRRDTITVQSGGGQKGWLERVAVGSCPVMSLDQLVTAIVDMIAQNRGNLLLSYDGVNIALDKFNVDIQWASSLEMDDHRDKNLKQALAFGNRMLEIVQFGRKLFDLLHTLAG